MFMEKKLELYELRRHGEDEVEYFDIEDLLFALKDAGYHVERHFYEDGEFSNKEVQEIIGKKGLCILPIVYMDEKLTLAGRYPSLDEIAHYFDVEISYQQEEGECCCGDDDGCCCGKHAQEDPEYEHGCCHHHEHEEHECCHQHEHQENEEHECCCHHHEEE